MKFLIASLILVTSATSFARSIECAPTAQSAEKKVIRFKDADLAVVLDVSKTAVSAVNGNNKPYTCTTTVDGLGAIRSVSCDRWDDDKFVTSTEVRLSQAENSKYSLVISTYETVRSDTGVSDKNLIGELVSKQLVCSVK